MTTEDLINKHAHALQTEHVKHKHSHLVLLEALVKVALSETPTEEEWEKENEEKF